MSKKIYVGNLAYTVGEADVREIFEKIGEVESVKIITDPATGRSKGFGFVEMSSDEDAQKAISTLNETSLMERTLTVSEARPQADRGKTGGRPGGRPWDKSFGKGKGPGRWK